MRTRPARESVSRKCSRFQAFNVVTSYLSESITMKASVLVILSTLVISRCAGSYGKVKHNEEGKVIRQMKADCGSVMSDEDPYAYAVPETKDASFSLTQALRQRQMRNFEDCW